MTWILISIVAALAAGYLALRAQRRALLPGAAPRSSPAGLTTVEANAGLIERGVADVRPQDVIDRVGTDWLVETVLDYEEAGHRWRAARMLDAGKESWLFVGLDRGPALNLRWVEPDAAIELSGYPPEVLERVVDGQRIPYQLVRRGSATATARGDTSQLIAGSLLSQSSARCRWWLYEAPGPRCLIVEDWGGTYRALAGEKIEVGGVDLLPGS